MIALHQTLSRLKPTSLLSFSPSPPSTEPWFDTHTHQTTLFFHRSSSSLSGHQRFGKTQATTTDDAYDYFMGAQMDRLLLMKEPGVSKCSLDSWVGQTVRESGFPAALTSVYCASGCIMCMCVSLSRSWIECQLRRRGSGTRSSLGERGCAIVSPAIYPPFAQPFFFFRPLCGKADWAAHLGGRVGEAVV